MKARNVRLFVEHGNNMVAVPLARDGKREAIIDHEDYSELLSLGLSPNWQIRGGSVSAHCPSGPVRTGGSSKAPSVPILVARVLTGAKGGQRVSYRDGDRLNLRRENLEVVTGWSSKNDRELVLASGSNASIA